MDSQPPDATRLVWIGKAGKQSDWLRFVFGDRIGAEAVAEPWPEPQPHTLYGIDTNWFPLARIPQDFLAAARRLPGVGLFQSDEFLGDDYNAYRHFAYVVRVHRAAAVAGPGILTLPLGWPNGGERHDPPAQASQRPDGWFFAGGLTSSRPEMLAAFRKVPRGNDRANAPRLDFAGYSRCLADAAFVPAPMGNIVIETWRLYEALEHGAIPIVEKRLTLDYYRDLFGDHPIPTFLRWSEAARFAERLLADPAALDRLQQEIGAWWLAHRQRLAADAQAFLDRGAADGWRAEMAEFRFPTGLRRALWQYRELLRHQSLGTIARRIGKVAARGSLARDMSHLDPRG